MHTCCVLTFVLFAQPTVVLDKVARVQIEARRVNFQVNGAVCSNVLLLPLPMTSYILKFLILMHLDLLADSCQSSNEELQEQVSGTSSKHFCLSLQLEVGWYIAACIFLLGAWKRFADRVHVLGDNIATLHCDILYS